MEGDGDCGGTTGVADEVDEEILGVGLGPGEEQDLEGGLFVFGGADGGDDRFEVVGYEAGDAVVVLTGVSEHADCEVGAWVVVGCGELRHGWLRYGGYWV